MYLRQLRKSTIDNNPVEVRHQVVGRKIFYLPVHMKAQNDWPCFIHCSSCKKHSVHPWEYLKDILERISTEKMSELRSVLPTSGK